MIGPACEVAAPTRDTYLSDSPPLPLVPSTPAKSLIFYSTWKIRDAIWGRSGVIVDGGVEKYVDIRDVVVGE